MTMVERVARAMAENAGFCWENCAQSQWESDARAGIVAMREPTPEMIDAHTRRSRESIRGECHLSAEALNAWWAMIDAALSEPPAP